MRTLRTGVSRLREELAALLGVDVEEVSGAPNRRAPDSGGEQGERVRGAGAPVLIGTEAVLHRLRRAAAVAFLDIDLHLLAPRLSATDETLALLVRAGRLVGPRGGPPWARVQLQTRVPDHPVLEAVVRGEPAPVLADEVAIRRTSGLPPFSALAVVSGPLAPAYADALAKAARQAREGEVVVATAGEGAWLVKATDHDALCDLLARVERPQGRGLRVAVDPPSF
jgi:primosomal protein N' (replication factor Y) (superfamily II helicase)